MPGCIALERDGDVAVLTLARPAHGNTFTGPMFDDLRKAVLELSDRPAAFVVVRGEGSTFCRGLTLDPDDPLYAQMEPIASNRDAYRAQEVITRLRNIVDGLWRLPCPVITAIEGACHGAGLELALRSDLRVASQEATFRLSEPRHAILSGLGGLTWLSLVAGTGSTLDLLLTQRTLTTDEATRAGLVHRSCPPGSALDTARVLIEEIRAAAHPTARLQALLATRAILVQRVGELIEHERQASARVAIAGDWRAELRKPGGAS